MFQVSTTTRTQRRGFTLHELLCVLALLVVAAVVAPRLVRYHRISSVDSATRHVELLRKTIDLYTLHVGTCPTTKQGLNALVAPPADLADQIKWAGPYFDTGTPFRAKDPWGKPFQYEAKSATEFHIWSLGPDGQNGTDDDISSTL